VFTCLLSIFLHSSVDISSSIPSTSVLPILVRACSNNVRLIKLTHRYPSFCHIDKLDITCMLIMDLFDADKDLSILWY
jgi:hypothetical protein